MEKETNKIQVDFLRVFSFSFIDKIKVFEIDREKYSVKFL